MERKREWLVSQLKALQQDNCLSPLVDFILEIILKKESEKIILNLITDDDVTTLNCKTEITNFAFCFWIKGQNRFSFFVEDREILDEFLKTEEESKECIQFVTTVLSNNLEIETYRSIKNNKVFRRIFRYFIIDQSGKPILFEDKLSLGVNFFWNKTIIDKKVISPLL